MPWIGIVVSFPLLIVLILAQLIATLIFDIILPAVCMQIETWWHWRKSKNKPHRTMHWGESPRPVEPFPETKEMAEERLSREIKGREASLKKRSRIEKAYEREAERIEKEYAARTGWR